MSLSVKAGSQRIAQAIMFVLSGVVRPVSLPTSAPASSGKRQARTASAAARSTLPRPSSCNSVRSTINSFNLVGVRLVSARGVTPVEPRVRSPERTAPLVRLVISRVTAAQSLVGLLVFYQLGGK